jgi:hypothetical protein
MAKKKAQAQQKTEEQMVPDVSAVEPAVPAPEAPTAEERELFGEHAECFKNWLYAGGVWTDDHAFQVLEDPANPFHVRVFRRRINDDGSLALPELVGVTASQDAYQTVSDLALRVHKALGRDRDTLKAEVRSHEDLYRKQEATRKAQEEAKKAREQANGQQQSA